MESDIAWILDFERRQEICAPRLVTLGETGLKLCNCLGSRSAQRDPARRRKPRRSGD